MQACELDMRYVVFIYDEEQVEEMVQALCLALLVGVKNPWMELE